LKVPTETQRVRFGAFEADMRSGELYKYGLRIKLQDQPFQLLALLLERPGDVITREELRQKLWSADTFVDFDVGLNTAVKRLRDALGDSAENVCFIETLPRRGYRFIAPVDIFRARGEAIDSVAVLPFVNSSADPNTEYLSDGITETIISRLSEVHNLRVKASSTVLRYKGKTLDPQAIGRELNVRAVLTGRVEQHGDNLSLRAELVDVSDGSLLWGDHYDRKISELLTLQQDISRDISRKLRPQLTGGQALRIRAQTTDPAAYQLYLKGRYFFRKYTRDSLVSAIACYEQAIAKDPTYAAPYTGLADAYDFLGRWYLPPQEVSAKAHEAALKALELDDSLADAHLSLANFKLYSEWDFAGAEREMRRAIELNPNDPEIHHRYSHVLVATGKFPESLVESQRALELDPLSVSIAAHMGFHYYFARAYDTAIEQERKALELDRNYWVTYRYMGLAYAEKHNYPEAIAALEEAAALLHRNPESLSSLAEVNASAGRRDQTLKLLSELKQISNQSYVDPYHFALVYVGLGDKEKAFASLEKAYEQRSAFAAELKPQPRLDPLRSDPRFPELMRRIGLPP
jgi:TolB-like protein/tetratricopeptide (TPR) repeat protein